MAEGDEELHILVVGVLVLFGTVTISHLSSSALDDKKHRLLRSSSKQFLGSGIDMINDRINDLINDMRSGPQKPTPD